MQGGSSFTVGVGTSFVGKVTSLVILSILMAFVPGLVCSRTLLLSSDRHLQGYQVCLLCVCFRDRYIMYINYP